MSQTASQFQQNSRQENDIKYLQNLLTDAVSIQRWIAGLDPDSIKNLEMEMSKQEVKPYVQRMQQTIRAYDDQQALLQTVYQEIENHEKQWQILNNESQKLADEIHGHHRYHDSKSSKSRSVSATVTSVHRSTHSKSDITKQNNGIKECGDTIKCDQGKYNKNSIYPSYMKYFDGYMDVEPETKESKSPKIKIISRKDENYRNKYDHMCNNGNNIAAEKTNAKKKKKKNKFVYINGKQYEVERLTWFCAMKLLFGDETTKKKGSTQRRFKILSRKKDNNLDAGDKQKIDNDTSNARKEALEKENKQ